MFNFIVEHYDVVIDIIIKLVLATALLLLGLFLLHASSVYDEEEQEEIIEEEKKKRKVVFINKLKDSQLQEKMYEVELTVPFTNDNDCHQIKIYEDEELTRTFNINKECNSFTIKLVNKDCRRVVSVYVNDDLYKQYCVDFAENKINEIFE